MGKTNLPTTAFVPMLAFTAILLLAVSGVKYTAATSTSDPMADEPLSSTRKMNKPDTFDRLWLTLATWGGSCHDEPTCRKLEKGETYPPWILWSLSAYNSTDPMHHPPCRNDTLNINDLSEIRAKLDRVWPSFTRRNTTWMLDYVFSHFGTCLVGNLSGIHNARDYFAKILQLYRQYDINRWFGEAGIKQSSNAPISLASLKTVFATRFPNGTTVLECDDRIDGSDILKAVRLCLNLDFQPDDCGKIKQTCDTEHVWFLRSLARANTQPGGIFALAVLVVAVMTLKNTHFSA